MLPHEHVFTRLGLSKIHGIGVFAITTIPKDTYIFKDDHSSVVWVSETEINFSDLPAYFQNFYNDFCIIKVKNNIKYYGCPSGFNQLTISWYLNHSEMPNTACDTKFCFYTLREINIGEELTVDYTTFNE